MEFRTIVDIAKPDFSIAPQEEMLFVGSCFADRIGSKFVEDKFLATVNPYGVMYNPVSILHTVAKYSIETDLGRHLDWLCRRPKVAFFTLGTNHVYRLIETGEIVDNCRKMPQRLFSEEELTVDECCDSLSRAVDILKQMNQDVKIVVTVSPIRYAKYGYHGSQLSKATLLLAADKLAKIYPCCTYFPAYEIVNDELRDYRFYAEDMLHPSAQAVEYIWERFSELYLSDAAKEFLKEWHPLKAAMAHRPFNPDSEEYKEFMNKTMLKVTALSKKYPNFAL